MRGPLFLKGEYFLDFFSQRSIITEFTRKRHFVVHHVYAVPFHLRLIFLSKLLM